MEIWVPAITSFTVVVTWFLIGDSAIRRRLVALLRPLGDAFNDILVTLGWRKEAPKRPTLADLINERRQIRFEEFAEWDADFNRLLPPVPHQPPRPHPSYCAGIFEELEEIKTFDMNGVVAVVLACTVCGWSGPMQERTIYQMHYGRLAKVAREEQILEEKYDSDYAELKDFKDLTYPQQFHDLTGELPSRGNIMETQREASYQGYYSGPIDGLPGPATIQAIQQMMGHRR